MTMNKNDEKFVESVSSRLMKCPDCGKEISYSAKSCPNCGCPIRKGKEELPIKKIGITLAVVIVFIIFGIGIVLGNKLSDEEQIDVNRVSAVIDDIGEVELTSEPEIIKAEKLYEELSKKCQHHVENRKKLSDARDTYNTLKAEEVEELINQMGKVSLSNQRKIKEVKRSYDDLLDEQKKLVNNAKVLLSAVKELSVLKIEDSNSKIKAIGKVTLKSEIKIKEARNSYDSLSDEDKSKVSNYDILTSAEKDYEKLVIDSCISLIDSIGEVTLDSKEKIDKAERQYNSLSDEAKDKITNHTVLASAVVEYKKLSEEEEIRKRTFNVGESFSTPKWEVTYVKTNISAKLLPNNTSGYYLYYSADDNETFIDIVLQIKNIDTDVLGIEHIVGTCKVEYDNSELTKSYNLYRSDGSQINPVYFWDGLDALESTTLHVAISMPREVQTNDKSIKVKLTIAGEEKMINVK
ncbi:MAG: hypothetical protein HFI37_02870 [Lachnospiraceae bacterium]|jgi:hypothetical protein|nr:hypothetical protein [Lachnospiraceae bacterium]